jgi:ATP-dependent Clp protease ATP-binding subunit ClpC
VQPDKSIDVIDEAGARVRLKSMTKPPDLAEIESDIEQLTIEKDEAVNGRLREGRRAARQGRPAPQEEGAIQKEWRDKSQETDGVVDEEVIAEVVSKMTGVPLQRLEKEEAQRLLELEKELHKKVISQHEAIRRSQGDPPRPRRPEGPEAPDGLVHLRRPVRRGQDAAQQGAGRVHVRRRGSLIQIDMSEYMEKHNVSRLVGAPPGYVGYEEGGQLTEQIRRRPYSVVLLDEIEKAHPDVFNMLLQIMEEGRLTDSFGRHVDFRNTILIMTSNIGADLIKGGAGFGFQPSATTTATTRTSRRS